MRMTSVRLGLLLTAATAGTLMAQAPGVGAGKRAPAMRRSANAAQLFLANSAQLQLHDQQITRLAASARRAAKRSKRKAARDALNRATRRVAPPSTRCARAPWRVRATARPERRVGWNWRIRCGTRWNARATSGMPTCVTRWRSSRPISRRAPGSFVREAIAVRAHARPCVGCSEAGCDPASAAACGAACRPECVARSRTAREFRTTGCGRARW